MPIFSENDDECDVIENYQNKGRPGKREKIKCINVKKLKEHPEINGILQQHLTPTEEINDKMSKNLSRKLI